MKKGKIFTNCLFSIWTLSVILSFASCSADGDSTSIIDERVPLETEVPFSVILKAYSENSDITAKGDVKSTTLYVFDENNDFYKQITVDKDYLLQVKPVEINCPGSDKITVVAWAGLSSESEEISNMNRANIISDLQVSLKHNNGIANNLPGDLFYGQIVLHRSSTKATAQELKIERKVSSMSILTKGALKVFDSKEGNYYYKIKRTKSSFNCNGELTGNDIEYIIPATLNDNGNLTTGTFSILPADNMTIELYRDDVWFFLPKMSKIQKSWLQTKENKQISFLIFHATISMLAFQTGVLLFSMLQSDNSTLNFLYAIGAHSVIPSVRRFFINMRFSVIGTPTNMIQTQLLISISSDYKYFIISQMIEIQHPYDIFTTHINTIDSVTL